jgi:hypothetical protein
MIAGDLLRCAALVDCLVAVMIALAEVGIELFKLGGIAMSACAVTRMPLTFIDHPAAKYCGFHAAGRTAGTS